jgi:putative FmdB family regulatory protein
MPFFNFRCAECGATSELLVSVGATPPCPSCGGHSLEKLLASPTPPGISKAIMQSGRQQAARAGHLSNFGGKK